jgi:hypothetical protein
MKQNEHPNLEEIKKNWIYINNVTQAIDDLYADVVKAEVIPDIHNNKTFVAIAKYFESIINKLCHENNMHLEKMYPVYIIPDDWKMESTDIINQIMIPLLTKAGVNIIGEYYQERVLFIGELEAEMAYFQLDKSSKTPLYLHNENRSVIYTMYDQQGTLKLKSVFLQVKEDYDLKLFEERCFSLKLLSRHTTDHSISVSNAFYNIRSTLEQFIFKDVLKMEHLIIGLQSSGLDTSVAKDIFDDIITDFTVCVDTSMIIELTFTYRRIISKKKRKVCPTSIV